MRRLSPKGAGLAVFGLSLGLLLGVADGRAGGKNGKPPLPKEAFEKLVAHDAKLIQEMLAKGALDKKSARKVKSAAYMIAVYAQAQLAGADAAAMAALRDNALKVLKLADENKAQEAAALARELSPNPKASPEGKAGPVPLEKQLEFENVMRQFSSERIGGFGLEKELEDLTEGKDAFTASQQERLALLGYKLAMIGHAADAYADEQNQGGKKTKQNWLTLTEQFRQSAVGLAEAAKSKNEGNIRMALEKLNASCTKCHDSFR